MSEPTRETLLRHAPATVHGRYLVRRGPEAGPACWLVGFHGYAQSAEVMLEPFAASVPSPHWLVASVQALHPFYAGRSDIVVANWMTRQDREHAIADNVRYVDSVLAQLRAEFGAPRALVFAGFSQGVAMAYRAALSGAGPCDALVVAGGDLPPEFAESAPRAWPRVLALTGDRETWYPPGQLERDAARVRAQGGDVTARVFAGGHEWGDAVISASRAFLAGIEAARTA